jgi:hypothetical protein
MAVLLAMGVGAAVAALGLAPAALAGGGDADAAAGGAVPGRSEQAARVAAASRPASHRAAAALI